MLAACRPGALAWAERWFGDCLYDSRDLLGFSCGLASICCWLVAQIPQLYRNYKTQSAEALSAWFLAEWLLGDTFNLLGALLKGDQPPTVVLTAQYFICVDAVMLVQYIYLTSLQHRRERMRAARRHRHHRHRRHSHTQGPGHGHGSGDEGDGSGREGRGGPRAGAGAAAAGAAGGHGHDGEIVAAGGKNVPVVVVSGGGGDVSFRPQRVLACLGTLLMLAQLQPGRPPAQPQQALPAHRRVLLAAAGALGGDGGGGDSGTLAGLAAHLPHWAHTAGSVLGYGSSCLYLASRVSQIWKNYRRGSAEGLAIAMFLCAICANSLYGASILIRARSWAQLSSSLPWLIGSLGTVALDCGIYLQWRLLGQAGAKHHPSDEDEPLLGEV